MRESMHDVAGKKGDTNEPDGRHGTREHAELCSQACPEACPQAAWYERACFVPAGVPTGGMVRESMLKAQRRHLLSAHFAE